jgi:hypothetical protein
MLNARNQSAKFHFDIFHIQETAEEKAVRKQIEIEAKKVQNDWKMEHEAEKAEQAKISKEKEKVLHGMKPLIYKGLAFFVNRLTCDLPTHTKNTLTAQSKNAGNGIENNRDRMLIFMLIFWIQV